MVTTSDTEDGLFLLDLINEVMRRAETPEAANRQLAGLLAATQVISTDLELPAAMHNVVEVARDLVSARHGSMVIIAYDGTAEKLIDIGAGDEEGGTLSAPVRVGGTVYGNLHFTGSRRGGFDEVDKGIVVTLAAMAGTAIANARLYEEARLGQRWLAASEEISQRLVSGELRDTEVAPIAALILNLSEAAFVGLVLPTDTTTATAPNERLFAQRFGPLADSPVFNSDREIGELPARVRVALDVTDDRPSAFRDIERWASGIVGSTIVIPWGDPSATGAGALVITRDSNGHPFSAEDRRMVKRFARSVAIARELASARNDRERVALTDERDRIARDLHDHVIQSLFAVGLGLQSIVGSATGQVAARIAAQVDAIDVTIRQIRQTIFELGSTPTAAGYSQKQRLNQLVRTILEGEGIDSSLDFRGPVDTLIDSDLGEEVSAVLREALSNVVRHAEASRVDISIAVTATEVRVVVTDNGRGLGQLARRSGLDNLEHRAHTLGGHFAVAGRAPSGTTLDWAVPVTQ
ncbi:MAG: Histidine kinaselike protein [Microbacteriaceae bacterium]|nr:Histidine kinaselike protein [Microbacteriaceae bacterium]